MGVERTVYLAGPDVFLRNALEMGARKKELCARYGFKGRYPFDNEVPADVPDPDRVIYRANVRMMREVDFGIFNLTPFRGPSADAGTVFELGLMIGLGKPVFGYTNAAADLMIRVKTAVALSFDPKTSFWRDPAGMMVEDFGNADNLMIDAALAEQGHPIVRTATRARDRFRDLTGFETCLSRAAEFYASAEGLPAGAEGSRGA